MHLPQETSQSACTTKFSVGVQLLLWSHLPVESKHLLRDQSKPQMTDPSLALAISVSLLVFGVQDEALLLPVENKP